MGALVHDADGTHGRGDEVVPPFPWSPIVILSFALVSNALYITTLFPFLPFITQDMTGIDDEREVVRAAEVACCDVHAGT